ncbi:MULTISPECIES: DUF962 domain-containing protein [Ralstonia]|uniref:Protein of uncharacterized function (DUF962) n=1 Tax=Ralstonia mannitolilytica TaxID=105219 RepID=A0AAJ4ZPT6_9RALS|nr:MULTISPECIES: Mpo1-like protein [Ralstonia]AJW47431.1 membrane protein [Ralstonia mannitolilytica]PLT18428.1 DUF962 domain-containing protein [Ralstonia mannitolilytica]QIF09833.1 DUF962 domain-containing protein [Ralstonia mannitolilytica]CAG2132851.1 hypothetical protein LMG6866_01025 [Ralstonia mannitolilytica]CAJ0727389.1 hypothetical protein R77592_01308 [Ralstonia mannitolilytica]
MRSLSDHLSNYAAYHQDSRNIATHFVGIPAIVLAVAVLLSRPAFAEWAGVAVTPALILLALVTVFYLRLDAAFGVVMFVLIGACVWVGGHVAAHSTAAWLSVGIGLFVIGWIIQFVGHYYEGRKPAFVDDLAGLVIGPLFLVAETAFAMGWRAPLRDEVVSRSRAMRAALGGKHAAA